MAIIDILHWTASAGWIVLSGGADAGGEIRSMALRRIKAHGGVAYLGFNEASADATLEDMEDLGAPTGYLVNIVTEDDESIQDQLVSASMIVIDDSVTADEWRGSLPGAAVEGMREALEHSAVILAEGTGAMALGGYILSDEGQFTEGLSWLQKAFILPGVASPTDSEMARRLLEADPKAIVVSIGIGSALALGADGQIEVWGERQVAIALGRDYQ
ncbi:MAG: hypothetical protein H7X77_04065 [Anaerolineae bacterium]|nr:hypothetical protein [Anaerolineae bacterium]